ncbi:hypothetical protein DAERI_020386 [Deinococcus aerius]|uniref:Uncharacterized protein n=1 Tax=Deinococcus aerius TaxID=200253 RepID=A0A2I9CSV8_9DEIO|nr:hypothetical protein [Deinococcus aerius]GBF04789.1 hypothetical protein DAERI_020386 [Deinococcus aerius]
MAWKISSYMTNRQDETDLGKAGGELITEERLGATNVILGLLPQVAEEELESVLDRGGKLTGTFNNPDGSVGQRTVFVEVR